MRTSPSIVPHDDDQDIYLVMDDFGGRLGLAWRETEPGSTDFETVIRDLLDGQYSNPVWVVGFNTAEGWSRDVSEDVANELRRRCDLESARSATEHARVCRTVRGPPAVKASAWLTRISAGPALSIFHAQHLVSALHSYPGNRGPDQARLDPRDQT